VFGFASEPTLPLSSVQLVAPIYVGLLQVICIPLSLLVDMVSALDDRVPPDLSLFALTNGSLDGFALATAPIVLLSAAPILMEFNIGITLCVYPVLDLGRVSLHGSQTTMDLTKHSSSLHEFC
jgi:L-cystine uptake protein TcyP (sodium:dicarboxylate symporter family)